MKKELGREMLVVVEARRPTRGFQPIISLDASLWDLSRRSRLRALNSQHELLYFVYKQNDASHLKQTKKPISTVPFISNPISRSQKV